MIIKIKNPSITWASFPGPCYDPQERYGDCPPDLLTLLRDERIPAEDRLWAFAHCMDVPDSVKRLFACKCVRDTPLHDGRKVWDLLTDVRSKNAVITAERFAMGDASKDELLEAVGVAGKTAEDALWAALWAAARAARAAAWAWDAARAAVDAADAARAAALSAGWSVAALSAGWSVWAAQFQFAISFIEE